MRFMGGRKKAFAIVITGGCTKYGNILLKKGERRNLLPVHPHDDRRSSNDGVRKMKAVRNKQ